MAKRPRQPATPLGLTGLALAAAVALTVAACGQSTTPAAAARSPAQAPREPELPPDVYRRAVARCTAAFAHDMAYLEPVGEPRLVSANGGGYDANGGPELRFTTRLADSFRGAPVGEVDCRFLRADLDDDPVLTKVRR